MVQLVSSRVMISLCVSVHHLSREPCAQIQNSVTSIPVFTLVLVMRKDLDTTALADWDSLGVTVKITCAIQILAFTVVIAVCIMATLNATVLQFSKEIDARFLTLVTLVHV